MTLHRRAWLIGTAATLVACGTKRARTPDERTIELPPDLDAILTRAALAPSRHNEQPWRVMLHGDDELLIRAKEALKLTVDRHGVAHALALGGFLKNLKLAAGRQGRRADVEVTGNAIAVSLSKSKTIEFDDALFSQRVTTRQDFVDGELDAGRAGRISRPAEGLHFLPRSSTEGKRLAELTMEGARAQLARADVRAELARWVHLDDDDAERLGDGYTLASLGITGGSAFALRNFLGTKAFEDPRFTSKAVARTQRHIDHTSGFLVLAVKDKSFASLVAGGELVQELALQMRVEGLGMHAMVQAVEEGDPAKVAVDVGLSGLAVFVARVGVPSSAPERQTFRRKPAAFVDVPDEEG